MSDRVVEVTRTSWFGRIGQSFVGMLIGLLLIVLIPVGLFWNESRAVTTERSLAEGAAAVVSIPSDAVDPIHEGKLVHLSGALRTDETLLDPAFGIGAEGVRLVRQVEMYQWTEETKTETETKLGGGEETVTTYSYSKGWEDEPVDSADFRQPLGHGNPSMEIREQRFQVETATLGAFSLDTEILDEVGGEERLDLARDRLDAVVAAFGAGRKASITDGRIYLGDDPTSPRIGDYRITYELVPLGVVSVVAKQSGAGFDAYPTQAGDKLLMVDRGEIPADKMFTEALTENAVLTWVLRVVGVFVLAIGFALMMGPLGTVADVLPPFGAIVRFGTGLAAMFLAVIVGAVTIAVAWIAVRPLAALIALGIGLGLAALIAVLGRRRVGKAGGTAGSGPQWGRPAPAG